MKTLFLKCALFLVMIFCTLPANAHANKIIDALFHNASDPIMGNPNGDIIIVEFFDYQCGHCSTLAKTIANVVKTLPNVKIIFKDYPIRGEASYEAAKAALAANMQGKYGALYYALLATEHKLTKSTILSIAKHEGLNIKKLQADMESKQVANQLIATKELGSFMGIPGTPILFIGKSNATNPKEVIFIPGAASVSEIQANIERLGK